MNCDFDLIKNEILNLYKKEIISIILFGSYSIGDFNKNSDIDLLIITKDNSKIDEKELIKIDNKIEPQILTKSEFKEKVLIFNPQLISIFTDGKILFDKNKYYQKNRNLFIALNYNKEYRIKYKNKNYSIKKMVSTYGF